MDRQRTPELAARRIYLELQNHPIVGRATAPSMAKGILMRAKRACTTLAKVTSGDLVSMLQFEIVQGLGQVKLSHGSVIGSAWTRRIINSSECYSWPGSCSK